MTKAAHDLWHAIRRADIKGNPEELDWWDTVTADDTAGWRVVSLLMAWHAGGEADSVRTALSRLADGVAYAQLLDFPGGERQ